MSDTVLKTHIFYFGEEPSGETLKLTTRFMSNTEGIYLKQNLTLPGYGNSATFELINCPFTPKDLRELANQLESEGANSIN